MKIISKHFVLTAAILCLGLSTYCTTYYVSKEGADTNTGTSWNQPFLTNTRALSAVAAEDEIWVAEGTYQEWATITIPKNTFLYGGFSGNETQFAERDIARYPVILDGRNSFRCVYNYGTIDGFDIKNGSAENGAGIYNHQGRVNYCEVYENTASYHGGGIVNYQGIVSYSDVYMNTTGDEGGGIYNDYAITSNCRVYDNTSSDQGGGIYNYFGDVYVSTVYENTADNQGGGIHNHYGTISSCKIYENTADDQGGGIHNHYGSIDQCDVYLNTSTREGGGIYDYHGSISSCDVFENIATWFGGGLCSNSGAITNSNIHNNESKDNGGGVYLDNGTLSLCDVNHNQSDDDGGGVYNSEGTMTSCNVSENTAVKYGGGVYSLTGSLSLCNIYANSARAHGGGIYNEDSGTVNHSNIYENECSTQGGGIYNSSGTISYCKVYDNASTYHGGGILNKLGTLDTNVIYHNLSGVEGGGVYNYSGSISSCTIVGNDAWGSGCGVFISAGRVSNSIIWGNESDDLINFEDKGTVVYNCYREADGAAWTISLDPLFVNIEGHFNTWDFHLKANSPCIDSGGSAQNGTEDLDGIMRPLGDGMDMGAYESTTALRAMFFSIDIHKFPGDVVYFQDASYGNPDEWQWDFNGDGVIDSTQQNPTYVYSTPGLYSVSLQVSKTGETDTLFKSEYIYISNVFYVKPDGDDANDGKSWQSPFQSISYAVKQTTDYDHIWVSAGTWQEGETITVAKTVSLYGGFFGNESELSERDIENYDSIIDGMDGYRCVNNYGLLDGFDIINGYAGDGAGIYNSRGTVSFCDVYENYSNYSGGGVFNNGTISFCHVFGNHSDTGSGGIRNDFGVIHDSNIYSNSSVYSAGGISNSHGIIRDSKIYMNQCQARGAGVYNSNTGIVSSCDVYENSGSESGGGIYNEGTVSSCMVEENTASLYGGGIYNNAGTVSECIVYACESRDGAGVYNKGAVNRCIVSNNVSSQYGGGIYNWSGTISLCKVYSNISSSKGGGIFNYYGNIRTNLIYHNTSGDDGGGIFAYSGPVQNCTLTLNKAKGDGDGIFFDDTSGIISNSIVWNNGSNDIFSGQSEVTYCCYREASDANGNISADPMFCNVNGSLITLDFHLKAGSPCIDSGSTADEAENDIDGIMRPQDNGTDMGAYESTTSLRALFLLDKRQGLPGDSFMFRDNSSGDPDEWKWDFNGDGVVDSSLPNPSYVYSEPGSYSVSLTVSKAGVSNTVMSLNDIHIGNIVHVKKDGNDAGDGYSWQNALQSIRGALAIASDFDYIWVAAGTYQEGDCITIPHKISVYGGFSGSEQSLSDRAPGYKSTIDGNNEFQCVVNNGLLDSFYIVNGLGSVVGGIRNAGIVQNCVVVNNNSSTEDGWGGIYNFSGIVENSTVYHNGTTQTHSGIKNLYGSVINTISWGNAGKDIDCSEYSAITFSCFKEGLSGADNISVDPGFVNISGDAASWDLHLIDGSPCVDAGTFNDLAGFDIEGYDRPGLDGLVCIGAYESPDAYVAGKLRVYVNQNGDDSDGFTWNTGFQTVEQALTIAASQLENSFHIWVAGGIYQEYDLEVPANVELYGGFSGTEESWAQRDTELNETVINALSLGRCVKNLGLADGFIITQGNGTEGGGVYNTGILRNCKIYENQSSSHGGGIYNLDGIVENCFVFINNAQEKGGGIFSEGGNVYRCQIYENQSAESGGGLYSSNEAYAENCVIFENQGVNYGGGVFNLNSTLMNCTIFDNLSHDGGGIDNWNGLILNSIVWSNMPDDIYYASGEIFYSCYSESDGSNQCIAQDPTFIDQLGRLKAQSPCIDSGTFDNAPSFDFDGIQRPQYDGIDMGAFEFIISTDIKDAAWSIYR